MALKRDNGLYHLIDLEDSNKTLYFTSTGKAAGYIGIQASQLDYAMAKNDGKWSKRWIISLEDGSEVPYKYINNVRL